MLHLLELSLTLCAQAERTPHRDSAGHLSPIAKPNGSRKKEGPPGDAERARFVLIGLAGAEGFEPSIS